MVSQGSIQQSTGHGAKAVDALDVTPGVDAAGWFATLYIITCGELESTLSYALEDSADNVSFAPVVAQVNGVAAQTVEIGCAEGEPPFLMYVRHSAVRRYHRLTPHVGAGDNFAAVAAVKLGADQVGASSVSVDVGG